MGWKQLIYQLRRGLRPRERHRTGGDFSITCIKKILHFEEITSFHIYQVWKNEFSFLIRKYFYCGPGSYNNFKYHISENFFKIVLSCFEPFFPRKIDVLQQRFKKQSENAVNMKAKAILKAVVALPFFPQRNNKNKVVIHFFLIFRAIVTLFHTMRIHTKKAFYGRKFLFCF